MNIDKKIMSEAILRMKSNILVNIMPDDVAINYVWDEYEKLEADKQRDKKEIHIYRLMEINGVRGVDWNPNMRLVTIKTQYGEKTYRTGLFTMDVLCKRTKNWIDKKGSSSPPPSKKENV